MGCTWVLKFPQVDLPKQPFLFHVTQKKGLDLDLLATDGEVAYRGKVRERNLSKLKAANYGGTDAQWLAILQYALIPKQDSGIDDDQRKNLEIQCAVSGKSSEAILAVTFRTRIEDITSRLGAIELQISDDTEDIDLFGWTSAVVDQRDDATSRLSNSETERRRQQAKINSLQKEVADLMKAKEEHEEQMLSKFTILLNEKKEKIRNQQRVMEVAKVDPKKLERLQSSAGRDQQTSAGTRKRKGKFTKHQVEDDDSDGFDAMDLDKAPVTKEAEVETDEDSQGIATASESEDERDLDDATGGGFAEQGRPLPSKALSPPPPPRTLPFQKRGEESRSNDKPATKTISAEKDGDTASEDDEL